jgi:hypothetical protein
MERRNCISRLVYDDENMGHEKEGGKHWGEPGIACVHACIYVLGIDRYTEREIPRRFFEVSFWVRALGRGRGAALH